MPDEMNNEQFSSIPEWLPNDLSKIRKSNSKNLQIDVFLVVQKNSIDLVKFWTSNLVTGVIFIIILQEITSKCQEFKNFVKISAVFSKVGMKDIILLPKENTQ